VVGVFGVKGWIKVQSYTRPTDNLLRQRRWFIGDAEHTLEEGRPHGPGLAVKIAGVEDRDAAAPLLGKDVSVPRSKLPRLRKDEVYWIDLMGSRVVTTAGVELGVLEGVSDNGAQDVMLVKQGEAERLIPWVVGPIVQRYSIEAREIVVAWEPDW